jgi:hypothetical protein
MVSNWLMGGGGLAANPQASPAAWGGLLAPPPAAPAKRSGFGRFFEDPEKVDALSAMLAQIGGGLIAAGTPTTDPSHAGRVMAQSLAGAGTAITDSKRDALRGRLTTAQIAKLEDEAKAKNEQTRAWQAYLTNQTAPASGGGVSGSVPAIYPKGSSEPLTRTGGAPAGASPGRPSMTPDQLAYLAAVGPEQGMRTIGSLLFAKENQPRIVEGADGYKYYVDGPNAGQRVLPGVTKPPPQLSLPQQSSNIQIEAARRRIANLTRDTAPGRSLRDTVLERMAEATATGRENPLYNPMVASDFRLAGQRMTGDDPGFDSFYSSLDRTRPMPPTANAPPAPAAGPGLLGRVYQDLFGPTGSDVPTPAMPADVQDRMREEGGIPAPARYQGGGVDQRRGARQPTAADDSTASMALPPDIKKRADAETFTEAELRRMKADDPDTFAALVRYLEAKETSRKR